MPQGFQIAMHGLNGGRINIASCSLGGATQALLDATDYLSNRDAFQQKLIDFQVHALIYVYLYSLEYNAFL